MKIDLAVSTHLRARMTEMASHSGVDLSTFTLLAIAEKVARLEHSQWLASRRCELAEQAAQPVSETIAKP